MIRLLKRIKLLRSSDKGDRKLLKYIPYALGEVILITIGLVLALQINNWNQSKGDFNESTEYLGELKEELNRNLGRLHYLKKGGYHDSWFVGLDKLDRVEEKINNHNTSLDSLFFSLLYLTEVGNTTWAMQRSIYLEGVNTGKLSNIDTKTTSKRTLYSDETIRLRDNGIFTSTSNNLKVHIHFYYGWMDKRESDIKDEIDSRKNAKDRCGNGLFILRSELASFVKTYYDGNLDAFTADEEKFNNYLVNHDWIKNRSSMQFRDAINYHQCIRNEIGLKATSVDEFIELTENLILLINEELARRK